MLIEGRGRRVLVSGGAGFVGSTLVRVLTSAGFEVTVVDSLLHGRRKNVDGVGSGVRFIEADVLDEEALEAVFAETRPEFVYHAVGDTFVPTAYELPRRFFRINLEGTLNVLLAAARWDIQRMLYISSTEVYGISERQPMDEQTPLNPANTYAVSKLAADRLCHTFVHEHRVPVIIARIFNTFGPRETLPYVIPEIIRQLHRGPELLMGDVDAHRDFTFVEDTARALMSLLHSDLPDGEAFNIGSGTSRSVRELVSICAGIMGRSDYRIVQDERRLRRREIQEFRADSSVLRAATGWAPSVSVEDGLRRTIDWFRENGSRWSYEDWCIDGIVPATRPAPLVGDSPVTG